MDIVYTFRQDIHALNNQLKYSLRSVEKHLKGVGNVFIIGAKPYLNDAIHIPYDDIHSPARNIALKLLAAANNPDVSEDFLYMADDHFILKSFGISSFPYFHNGTLMGLIHAQRNTYKQILINTINALHKRDSINIAMNFNVHSPIVYNKTKIRQLHTIYDFTHPMGFVFKSLYMHTFRDSFSGKTFEQLSDCKIRSDIPLFEMRDRIKDRPVFSTGKEYQCPNIYALLKELYPDKSKYES